MSALSQAVQDYLEMRRAMFKASRRMMLLFATSLAVAGLAAASAQAAVLHVNGERTAITPNAQSIAFFSAFGISFSDIGQNYEVGLSQPSVEAAQAAHDLMLERAERDMFQEGHDATAEQAFRDALTRAGLRPLRFHDLRHYADGGVMCPAGLFGLVRALPVVILSA